MILKKLKNSKLIYKENKKSDLKTEDYCFDVYSIIDIELKNL